MKLLFDENLSPRLAVLLSDVYPGSAHVEELGLGSEDDRQVWAYAKVHGLMIVSKDSDFADLSVLEGAPPKVVWVRLGNCTTASAEFLLRNSVETIRRFEDGMESYLILGKKIVR